MLRDVSLTLRPGRIIEVTGPNGAGKSTLLRLLAGVLRPARGDVEGRPAQVGYAPERFPAGQPFTPRGYLAHMARVHGAPVASVAAWADRLRFAGSLDVPLTRLSKGNAHKVGLAQALLGDPGLLVLDEPFAGLDAETRAELPALLSGLRSRGATLVVSDHQGCLRDLPDVEGLEVTGHTVHPVAVPILPVRAERAGIEREDRVTPLKLIVGGYGDSAALLFPVWAWAARGLLDTEPDGQRELSALAAGRIRAPAAALLAAYILNVSLGVLLFAVPLVNGLSAGVPAPALWTAVALHLVVAVPATLLGALTTHAVLSSTAVSILVLLSGCVALLLLSMGPLSPISIPMIEWLRAAHEGPGRFTSAFPGVAAHIALWSAVAGAGYAMARRGRP